jgi:hypothetical protein
MVGHEDARSVEEEAILQMPRRFKGALMQALEKMLRGVCVVGRIRISSSRAKEGPERAWTEAAPSELSAKDGHASSR